MNKRLLIAIAAGFLFADLATPLLAKETALRPIEVDDYFALKYVGSPTVSPDGKWIAYTVRSQDLENDSRETRIWMSRTAGGEPLEMSAKGSSAWGPA